MRTNLSLYYTIVSESRQAIKTGEFCFYCDVCGHVRKALAANNWNLRNGVYCESCRQGGRFRHSFKVISDEIERKRPRRKIIFEAVTDFKKILDAHFPGFAGSEYLGLDKTPGKTYDFHGVGVRHEDMCRLSYADNSIDLIVSMDVLEHIPDMSKGLEECFRVLRPGGTKILTVPFYDNINTVRRAEIVNEELNHIHKPQYHGNPLNRKGSLVFFEPGIDLLDVIRSIGWSPRLSLGANTENGYFPDACPKVSHNCWNIVFHLTKPET